VYLTCRAYGTFLISSLRVFFLPIHLLLQLALGSQERCCILVPRILGLFYLRPDLADLHLHAWSFANNNLSLPLVLMIGGSFSFQ
ncbi:hypothetical protein KI387_007492, partial [Taxus chinensis]